MSASPCDPSPAAGAVAFARRRCRSATGFGLCLVMLAACGDGAGLPGFLQSRDTEAGSAATPSRSTRLVERDVEAPEVFDVTEPGLWDGRPSLGGVWVAHPDVSDPERVIIRNSDTGSFVIGALFRKERATPGPRLQVSSDAAMALGMVAGQPAALNVTALRRAEAEDAADAETASEATAPSAPPTGTSDAETSGGEPDAAETRAAPATSAPAQGAAAASTAALAPPAATPASTLARPFIQIGIFSVESNANSAAAAMLDLGLSPQIKPGTSSGQDFWRVIVGPAATEAARADMLRRIQAEGFADAYAVSN